MSFDVQGFHVELFAAPDSGATAAAIRTDNLPLRRMILRAAIHTLQFSIDVAKVQRSCLGDGALADLVPIELHGIIAVGGNLTDDDIDIGDLFGILFSSFFEGLGEYGLGGVEFMHNRFPK